MRAVRRLAPASQSAGRSTLNASVCLLDLLPGPGAGVGRAPPTDRLAWDDADVAAEVRGRVHAGAAPAPTLVADRMLFAEALQAAADTCRALEALARTLVPTVPAPDVNPGMAAAAALVAAVQSLVTDAAVAWPPADANRVQIEVRPAERPQRTSLGVDGLTRARAGSDGAGTWRRRKHSRRRRCCSSCCPFRRTARPRRALAWLRSGQPCYIASTTGAQARVRPRGCGRTCPIPATCFTRAPGCAPGRAMRNGGGGGERSACAQTQAERGACPRRCGASPRGGGHGPGTPCRGRSAAPAMRRGACTVVRDGRF